MDPMNAPNATAAPADPYAAVSKQASAVMQALALMYKECHQVEPDGPLCNAIQQIMKAVSEVERHIKAHGPNPVGAGGPPVQDHTQTPAEVGAAPGPGGPPPRGPFGAAAQGLHQDMMTAAKRKQPPGGAY